MKELIVVDETVAPGDLLDAADFDFLAFFDDAVERNEIIGLSQTGTSCLLTPRVMGWRREPERPARMMAFMGGRASAGIQDRG